MNFKRKFLFGALLSLFCTSALPEQTTLLSSSARTSTTTSADVVKGVAYRGIHVILNVTVVPGIDTLTPKIQGKSAGGTYYDMLVGNAAATTGVTVLKIVPAAVAIASAVASDAMPDVWRVIITHSSITSFTYSVDYNTLP